MAKATKPQPLTQASAGLDTPTEALGVDICPEGSVFNCNTAGVVMSGKGYARMYSALDGIQTLTALLFQREIDRDCPRGIVVSENVSIGLLNALGACTEFAQFMFDGGGGHSRTIDTDHADYPALKRLVNSRP